MKIVKILFQYLILPVAIAALLWLTIQSIMEPVNFNKEKAQREEVAIQRLKDLRDLQVAFKGVYGHFSPTIDSLKDFYNNGKIDVELRIGSDDDSLAVANTAKIKKANPKITDKELYQRYLEGESVVCRLKSQIPVKDTLFAHRANFSVDSLGFIPFSGKQPILMESIIKTVSGVQVPLFEASMPYKSLLRGMDNQLRINLDAEREDTGRYPGLKVGSVTAPNNNAGNWE